MQDLRCGAAVQKMCSTAYSTLSIISINELSSFLSGAGHHLRLPPSQALAAQTHPWWATVSSRHMLLSLPFSNN